jgi:hypothetical protein
MKIEWQLCCRKQTFCGPDNPGRNAAMIGLSKRKAFSRKADGRD